MTSDQLLEELGALLGRCVNVIRELEQENAELKARRECVGLTDEERLDAFDEFLEDTAEGKRWRHMKAYSYSEDEREAFDAGWAAAEAALKEKNNA